MPEYLAILLVTAGLVVLVAVLLIVAVMRIHRQMASQATQIEQKIDSLAVRLGAIEEAYGEHSSDLEAIRSEYAVHFATQSRGNSNHEEAIKAVSSGLSIEELTESYGLREAEAKLLVSVYGNQ